MKNEKLMKIVQAVNDSRATQSGIFNSKIYIYVARLADGNNLPVEYDIHEVNSSGECEDCTFLCTVTEFNQFVKEMSAGYSKKGGDMKDNKHPHHDLIADWIKDTSKTIIETGNGEIDWVVGIKTVIGDREGVQSFHFKPREFVKGHWYPCFHSDRDVYIKKYNGSLFFSNGNCKSISFSEGEFVKIGESLGEIEFGE